MSGYKIIPLEPPEDLIDSMCLRFDHSFFAPIQELGGFTTGYTEERREVLRRDMRKVYEEVAGTGFYRWKD